MLKPLEKKLIKIFDRRDIRIRIPLKGKWPLIKNWTKYYSEPWTIENLLEKGYNYGIRCGRPIGNYYNIVLDLDDIWAEERIKSNHYIQTKNGVHLYLLIKELPKSCYLVNKEGKKIGELHSKGRQVVGVGSIHPSSFRYTLKGKNFSAKKFESLKELTTFLKERGIFLAKWGNDKKVK